MVGMGRWWNRKAVDRKEKKVVGLGGCLALEQQHHYYVIFVVQC